MAVEQALCRSLKGDIYAVARPGEFLSQHNVKFIHGNRHQTLKGADQFFKDAQLPHRLRKFKKIIAMIRNPYEIEVSWFHYLRLGHEWDAGKAQNLAKTGNFAEFVRGSTWWFDYPDYYTVGGVIPTNLHIIRYEDFPAAFSTEFANFFQTPFVVKKVNVSHKTRYSDYYDRELESHVYRKYQWLFDQGYYKREKFGRRARLSVFSDDDDWIRWHPSKPTARVVRRLPSLSQIGDMQFWVDGLYRLLPLSPERKAAISAWFYARIGFLFRNTNGYQRWLSRERNS
jgi:hypothetical protein